MVVSTCTHETRHKHGKDRKGNTRYKCALCGKTFVNATAKPIGDMRIDPKKAVLALSLLLEGMSIRAVERLTGLCRDTVTDLILIVGENCQRLLDGIRGVEAKDVQLDELWSFVGMKDKSRVARGLDSVEIGDSWTFLAIERDTKLILAHQVGQRDSGTCVELLEKLARATVGRFQLTTDGLRAYKLNVPFIMGHRVDFAQLVKVYHSGGSGTAEARYSPAKIISSEKQVQFGEPDEDRISTSHIERFNLTMRMTLRRFTRLTNAHSKSHRHHVAMQAIFVAWYNFARKHETLKGASPAMASGLAGHVWTVKELLEQAAL